MVCHKATIYSVIILIPQSVCDLIKRKLSFPSFMVTFKGHYPVACIVGEACGMGCLYGSHIVHGAIV